jgi:hypothetical protein
MSTENNQPIIDHVPSASELAPVVEHDLLHTSVEVPELSVISKDEALKGYGINADIRAIITLPSDESQEPAKQIAILDFGEFDPANPPFVIALEGRANYSQLFGMAKGRFGVYGLNYSPKDHLSSYEVLEEGITDFGSSSPEYVSGHSLLLGLTEVAAGNDSVASNHFSVEVSGTRITIADHSDLGTKVKFANDNATPEPSIDDEVEGFQPIGVNNVVNVMRSDGSMEAGWIVTGIMEDELTGKKRVMVIKPHPTDDPDNVKAKVIDLDELQKLN